jgi:hypothetical protein
MRGTDSVYAGMWLTRNDHATRHMRTSTGSSGPQRC